MVSKEELIDLIESAIENENIKEAFIYFVENNKFEDDNDTETIFLALMALLFDYQKLSIKAKAFDSIRETQERFNEKIQGIVETALQIKEDGRINIPAISEDFKKELAENDSENDSE